MIVKGTIIASNILEILKVTKERIFRSKTKWKGNFVNIELIENVLNPKKLSL